MGHIDSLVRAVRTRLNQRRTLHSFLWAFLISAGILLVVAALYLLRGYAVPRELYWAALAVAMIGGAVTSVLRRLNSEAAVRFTDEFFHLRDAITSNREFRSQHKEGGFYELQNAMTEGQTAALSAEKVSRSVPRALVIGSTMLVAIAGLTAFKGPSDEVLKRQKQEAELLEKTKEIRTALEEELEELKKSTDDPEELEALNSDEIKKMLEQLKATNDLKEALRQMADLEKRINETARKLDTQKKDEQIFKKAGEELEKAEDPNARGLGKKLKQEQFKDAKQKLATMKPDGKEKTPEEQKKEVAKLKAAAKRMAAAARRQKKSANKKSGGEEKDENGEESEEMEEDTLEEDLEKLEEETKELEEATEKGDKEKMGKCQSKVGERMDKLGKRMSKLNAKKNAQSKLMSLSKKLGQCQNYCQGTADVPFWLRQPGGLKPGTGTDKTRRNEKDELKDNGQFAQIKGQKNEGPSFRKVEDAEDGTGVSNRTAKSDKERSFARQFESFVNREDVPEEVKEGVKSYFQSLHESGKEVTPNPANAEPDPSNKVE